MTWVVDACRDYAGGALIRAGWAVLTDQGRDQVALRIARALTLRGWRPSAVTTKRPVQVGDRVAAVAETDDGRYIYWTGPEGATP